MAEVAVTTRTNESMHNLAARSRDSAAASDASVLRVDAPFQEPLPPRFGAKYPGVRSRGRSSGCGTCHKVSRRVVDEGANVLLSGLTCGLHAIHGHNQRLCVGQYSGKNAKSASHLLDNLQGASSLRLLVGLRLCTRGRVGLPDMRATKPL